VILKFSGKYFFYKNFVRNKPKNYKQTNLFLTNQIIVFICLANYTQIFNALPPTFETKLVGTVPALKKYIGHAEDYGHLF
jgi:hypothetical protein